VFEPALSHLSYNQITCRIRGSDGEGLPVIIQGLTAAQIEDMFLRTERLEIISSNRGKKCVLSIC
jgi:hypothetical protein